MTRQHQTRPRRRRHGAAGSTAVALLLAAATVAATLVGLASGYDVSVDAATGVDEYDCGQLGGVPCASIGFALDEVEYYGGGTLYVEPSPHDGYQHLMTLHYLSKNITVIGLGGPRVGATCAGGLSTATLVLYGEARLILRHLRIANCNGGDTLIGMIGTSRLIVEDCEVTSNSARLGAFAQAQGNTQVELRDSVFHGNTAPGGRGGVVQLINQSKLKVTNCQLLDNSASYGGILYSYGDALIVFENSVFRGNAALDGAVVYAQGHSKVTIRNCSMVANRVKLQPGYSILNMFAEVMEIRNCTFASNVGHMLWLSFPLSSSVNVYDCNFLDNFALQGAAAFVAGSTQLHLTRCHLVNNTAAHTAAQAISQGGAVYVEANGRVFTDRSEFRWNSATYGGAVYLTDAGGMDGQKTVFVHNRAVVSGGAIMILDRSSVVLKEVYFRYNAAVWGGAVFSQSTPLVGDPTPPPLQHTFTTWADNSASQAGGAIYFAGGDYNCSLGHSNVFARNQAGVFGSNVAAFATGSRSTVGGAAMPITSGSLISNPVISIALLDACGNDMTGADVPATLRVLDGPFQATGSSASGMGSASFANLAVIARPGSTQTLVFRTVTPPGVPDTSLNVTVRRCEAGEWFDEAALQCHLCAAGEYSYSIHSQCLACPRLGVCFGGNQVSATNGAWAAGMLTDTATNLAYPLFAPCPSAVTCIGPRNPLDTATNWTCTEGYTGILCAECTPGFARSSQGACTACPSPGSAAAATVILCLLGAMFAASTIYRMRKAGPQSNDVLTQAAKILASYFQFVSMAHALNTLWPSALASVFEVQVTVSSGGTSLAFLECMLQNSGTSYDALTVSLGYILMLPVLLVATILGWCCAAGVTYLRAPDKSRARPQILEAAITNITVSVVVIVFMLYPMITGKIIQIFACLPVVSEPDLYGEPMATLLTSDRQWYLRMDPGIACYDERHNWWMLVVGLPSVLLIVIGVPLFTILRLRTYRTRLTEPLVQARYGFLIAGYSAKCYYWETMLMTRKMAVIAAIQLLAQLGGMIQTVGALCVVFVSYILHAHLRPYDSAMLRNLEKTSLGLSFATFAVSTVLQPLTNFPEAQVFIAAVLIAANIAFVLFTGYQVRSTFLQKVQMTRSIVQLKASKSFSSFRASRSASFESSPEPAATAAFSNPSFAAKPTMAPADPARPVGLEMYKRNPLAQLARRQQRSATPQSPSPGSEVV